ncbi:hypothetical protein C8R41DRAFT_838134 [Lentinula lateritia]|uniref:Uncharacterized protein n=1 Tax=Lentinula lateritia TaxID=40482 RepID=A0ABQ8VCR5_9AGAR|nr:hypothetical protein C8R41DRAFT_838134 [Lentinula lateritia]
MTRCQCYWLYHDLLWQYCFTFVDSFLPPLIGIYLEILTHYIGTWPVLWDTYAILFPTLFLTSWLVLNQILYFDYIIIPS